MGLLFVMFGESGSSPVPPPPVLACKTNCSYGSTLAASPLPRLALGAMQRRSGGDASFLGFAPMTRSPRPPAVGGRGRRGKHRPVVKAHDGPR